MQPVPPSPTPVFDFEDERFKNSPLFVFNGQVVEKANDNGIDALRAGKVVMCNVSLRNEAFEWVVMQLVGLQKKFDQAAIFTIISGYRPETAAKIQQLTPYVAKLNLVYDSLGS